MQFYDCVDNSALSARERMSSIVQTDLLAQLGSDSIDMGKLGNVLFDLSLYEYPDTSVAHVRDFQKRWRNLTNNGQTLTNELFDINAEVAYFQRDLQAISEIRKPEESYLFYAPGSAGMIRFEIMIDTSGNSKIVFADAYGDQDIISRFNGLFKN